MFTENPNRNEMRTAILPKPVHVTREQAIERAREKAKADESKRGWKREYPDNPMVDEAFAPDPVLVEALRRTKNEHPFRVTGDAFERVVRAMYRDLAEAFELPIPRVTFKLDEDSHHFARGFYNGNEHAINLEGPPSILTAMHEFMHAAGYGEQGAIYYSVNLFRVTWPKSFARLRPVKGSHVLRRSRESAAKLDAIAARKRK